MPTSTTKMPVKAQVGYLHFPDGRTMKVRPADNRRFTVKEMQKAVGGYVEPIIPRESLGYRSLICNEEAFRMDLEYNKQTPQIVDMVTYKRNGYDESWRVKGNMFGVKYEDFDGSLPTINQVMRREDDRKSIMS